MVWRFRQTRLERKPWVYPLFLATFPVYYWVFALHARDYPALAGEMLAATGFVLVAWLAWRFPSLASLLLLAAGYVAHGAYDVWHDAFFINRGTPGWWPAFCGAVDLLIGLYLLCLAFTPGTIRQHEY